MQKKTFIIITLITFLFTAPFVASASTPWQIMSDLSKVYYAVSGSGATSEIRAVTQLNQTADHPPRPFTGGTINHALVLPSGLYIYYVESKTVKARDLITDAIVTTGSIPNNLQPGQMVATKEGDYVYMLLKHSDATPASALAVIDAAKPTDAPTLIPLNAPGEGIAIANIRTEIQEKGVITAASLNQYLLVTDAAGSLEIIKLGKTPSEDQALTPLPLNQNLSSITVGPNSQYAYVTHKAPDEKTISVIDLSKLLSEPRHAVLVLQPIQLASPVSLNDYHMAFSQSGRYVYIATTSGVAEYEMEGSPPALKLKGTLLKDNSIRSLAIDPASKYLYALWTENSQKKVEIYNLVSPGSPVTTGLIANTIFMPPPTVYIPCPTPTIWTKTDTQVKTYDFYGPAQEAFVDSTYPNNGWAVEAGAHALGSQFPTTVTSCTFATATWDWGWHWHYSTVILSRASSVAGLPNHYIKDFNPNAGAGGYNIDRVLNKNDSYVWWTGYKKNTVPTTVTAIAWFKKTIAAPSATAEYKVESKGGGYPLA